MVAPPHRRASATFNGIAELAGYLAGSDDVKHCLVRYWSYYAYGTRRWAQDACTYTAIQNEAAQNNFTLKSVLTGDHPRPPLHPARRGSADRTSMTHAQIQPQNLAQGRRRRPDRCAASLSLLEGKRAQSAAGRVKRVLLFCTMGTQPEIWSPTAVSGENITTFSAATQPLAAIRENIVLVEGLPSGAAGEGHGSPQALCGLGFQYTNMATSVDQFISDRLQRHGRDDARSRCCCWATAPTTPRPGARSVPAQRQPAVPARVAEDRVQHRVRQLRAHARHGRSTRSRIAASGTCDRLQDEIAELQGRLGPAERNRLEAHKQSITQIQARLAQAPTMPTGSCAVPTMPTDSTNPLTNNRMHLDLIVNAFACDITRVAGIHYGNDQSLKVDLPSVMLTGNQHTDFIHSGKSESYARLAKFEAWLAGEFAYVVGELKKRDEMDGSGKLLDNTLVVWCRDLGDADMHNQNSMRFVLAGGANKYLKTSADGPLHQGPLDADRCPAPTSPTATNACCGTSARRWASRRTPASATRTCRRPTRSRSKACRSSGAPPLTLPNPLPASRGEGNRCSGRGRLSCSPPEVTR